MGNKTDVMVKPEMAVGEALPRVDVMGADELSREDVTLPRLRIQQGTSQFGTPQTAGQFYNNLTEGFAERVNAVVLRVGKGRVMFPVPFNRDSEPLCASDDAKMPREVAGYEAGPCASCAFAQWGADHEPPACSLVYTYLVANVDDEDTVTLLSAMRTSVAAAKKMNSIIVSKGLSRRFTFATELVRGEQGQWFELRATVAGVLTREQQGYYADMMRSMAGVAMTVDTDENSVVGAEGLTDEDLAPVADAFPDGAPF
jgi:hypothetical protein